MSSLDKSWKEKANKEYGFHDEEYYIIGASDFQQKAIEELEKESKSRHLYPDLEQGIKEGLEIAIEIIKNLKP